MLLNIKQNKTVRDKNYIRIINKIIQSYINNPIGDLSLWSLPINKLPNNLSYINGSLVITNTNISELPDDIIIEVDLYCWGTPLSEKYTERELKNKYNIKGYIWC